VVSGDWPEQVVLTGMALRLDLDTNCWVIHVPGDGIWDVEASRVYEEHQYMQVAIARAMLEIQAQAIFDEEPAPKPLDYPAPSAIEPRRFRVWVGPELRPYTPTGNEYLTAVTKEWL